MEKKKSKHRTVSQQRQENCSETKGVCSGGGGGGVRIEINGMVTYSCTSNTWAVGEGDHEVEASPDRIPKPCLKVTIKK